MKSPKVWIFMNTQNQGQVILQSCVRLFPSVSTCRHYFSPLTSSFWSLIFLSHWRGRVIKTWWVNWWYKSISLSSWEAGAVVALLPRRHKAAILDSRASIHPPPAPCPLQAAQHSKSGLPLAQLKTPAQGNTRLPATEGRLPAVAKKEGTPAWHPTEKEALCSAASQGARHFPPLYHRDFWHVFQVKVERWQIKQ